METNLVDSIWADQRPARPSEAVTVLPDHLAGKSVRTKLTELRKELEKRHSPGFLVSMLDEVAWLFNLRGNDIPFNPVFFSYAIITPESATLYTDDSRLNEECRSHLTVNGVDLKSYTSILEDARILYTARVEQELPDDSSAGNFLLSNKGSWALQRALGGESTVDEVRSPIGDAKAIKNEIEMNGMRACHVRDGAALIEYFAWLEDRLVTKKAVLDEVEAADQLEKLRSKQQNFVGLSFPTISSTGAK